MRNFVKTAAAAALLMGTSGCDILSLLEQQLEDLGIDVEATIDDNEKALATFDATIFAIQGEVFDAIGDQLDDGEGPEDDFGPDDAGPDGSDGPGAMPMEEMPDDLSDGPGDLTGPGDLDGEFEDINLTESFAFTANVSDGTLTVEGQVTITTDGPDNVSMIQDISVEWTNLKSEDVDGNIYITDGIMLLQASITVGDESITSEGSYKGQMTIDGGTFGYDITVKADGQSVTYSGIVNGEEVSRTVNLEDLPGIDDGDDGKDMGPGEDEEFPGDGSGPTDADSDPCGDVEEDTACFTTDGEELIDLEIGTVTIQQTIGITLSYFDLPGDPNYTQNLQVVIPVDAQVGTVECSTASALSPKIAYIDRPDGSGGESTTYQGGGVFGSCEIDITAIGTDTGDLIEGTFVVDAVNLSDTNDKATATGSFSARVE